MTPFSSVTEATKMTEPEDDASDKAKAASAVAQNGALGQSTRIWTAPKVSRLSIAETDLTAGSNLDGEGGCGSP
jgi:hypothetical protein